MNDKIKKYTLLELKKIHKIFFQFLLWMKHLVAKLYFSYEQELLAYLLKNYYIK